MSQVYGVQYEVMAKGGRGKYVVCHQDFADIFITEKELITRLAELQNDDNVKNIKPFIGRVVYEKDYELKLK